MESYTFSLKVLQKNSVVHSCFINLKLDYANDKNFATNAKAQVPALCMSCHSFRGIKGSLHSKSGSNDFLNL